MMRLGGTNDRQWVEMMEKIEERDKKIIARWERRFCQELLEEVREEERAKSYGEDVENAQG